MKTSESLAKHRDEVLEIIAKYPVHRPSDIATTFIPHFVQTVMLIPVSRFSQEVKTQPIESLCIL